MTFWILAMMVALQPPESTPWADSYLTTAAAIATAVETEPPLFAGPDAVAKTAAAMVALSWFESRFDVGAVGDHGRSHGLYQIERSNLSEGVTEETIKLDAELATREAMRLLRQSMRICRNEKPDFGWAWYAAGGRGCRTPGFVKSAHRIALGRRLFRENPYVAPDDVD